MTFNALRRLRGGKPKEDRPNSHRRGYTRAWSRFRLSILSAHPLCVHCAREGKTTAANEVDHIKPIAQGGGMFDEKNVQALCKKHHSIKTAAENRLGG